MDLLLSLRKEEDLYITQLIQNGLKLMCYPNSAQENLVGVFQYTFGANGGQLFMAPNEEEKFYQMEMLFTMYSVMS